MPRYRHGLPVIAAVGPGFKRSRLLLLALLLVCLCARESSQAVGTQYRTRNVFIVCIDGIRGTEAFDAEDPAEYIPNMWNHLRSQGSLYRNFYNLGATYTTPGNSTILDGCWEFMQNNSGWRAFRPGYPTVFEYYRYSNPQVAQNKVWAVVGHNNLYYANFSEHPLYGQAYGAALDFPAEGWRSDGLTWSRMQSIMDQHHPSLVFLHLVEVDKRGHDEPETGNWSWYLQTIRQADQIVYDLWNKIQSDAYYRDQTTLLVTTDHGRHDDAHGGFANHCGICEGCKRLFLLALGPDIRAGQVYTDFRQQTDVCPTVGELMRFDTPFAEGCVLQEMLLQPDGRSTDVSLPSVKVAAARGEVKLTGATASAAQPDIAVGSRGLHVVWADDRSGQRQIYYKRRALESNTWSDDVQISASSTWAQYPSVAVDGEKVHVTWQEYANGSWEIRYRRSISEDDWSASELVARSQIEGEGVDHSQMVWKPQVAVCQGEVLIVAAVASEWLRAYRRQADGRWTSSTIVGTNEWPGCADKQPQAVSVSCSGISAHAVWQEVNRRDWMLNYSGSANAGASWRSPVRLTYEGGVHDASIASSGDSVHAAWIAPPGVLRYTRSSNSGSSWRDPVAIETGQSWNPDLAAAPGVVVLAWEGYRQGLPAILLGKSTDGGLTWQREQVSHGAGFSIAPAVATDGQKAYLVWRDQREGGWQLYFAEAELFAQSPTPFATQSATATASPTQTTAPSATWTATPTAESTATASATPTASSTTLPTASSTTTLTPTPTSTASSTVVPTPSPTPTQFARCMDWDYVWNDEFQDARLLRWYADLGQGVTQVQTSTLRLSAPSAGNDRFPLLWTRPAFPVEDCVLELRFRFDAPAAYGASIGVGTRLYDGRRFLEGEARPTGINDVLSIEQSSQSFSMQLLGQVAWNGECPDMDWHVVRVVQSDEQFGLFVDGAWVGAAYTTSHILRSISLGNALVAHDPGVWTSLCVDYVRIGVCRCRETDPACP